MPFPFATLFACCNTIVTVTVTAALVMLSNSTHATCYSVLTSIWCSYLNCWLCVVPMSELLAVVQCHSVFVTRVQVLQGALVVVNYAVIMLVDQ